MTNHTVTHSTFSLERTYPVPPEQVFSAWADAAIKVRWFAKDSEDYELDFRPGGVEHNRVIHDGKPITWESLYREILADERIVYTSVLYEQDMVATVSLTTVEFAPEGEGTHLVLVEAGAFLDERERPEWREQGTGEWLDALGKALVNQPG